ncbi:hypothetical protein Tco_0231907 [Tanacetum coccineum]
MRSTLILAQTRIKTALKAILQAPELVLSISPSRFGLSSNKLSVAIKGVRGVGLGLLEAYMGVDGRFYSGRCSW